MSGRTPTSIAMHALTLDHLTGGRVVLGHGRERSAGRRGLVRRSRSPSRWPAPARSSTSSARCSRARGAGHQRRPALPAALRRRGRHRPRQAAQADRAPAARRHPDLARRRGPEERRADRRDRRRLDPDLLHAEVGRACTSRGSTRASPGPGPGVPARTSRSPRPATCRSSPDAERSRPSIEAMKPIGLALHGRHGRQGAELPQAGLRADGLRRRSPTRSRSSTSTAARTRPPR